MFLFSRKFTGLVIQDVQASRKPNFIVDVDEDDGDEDGDEEFDDLFDHVCAICDNGGELLRYILVYIYLKRLCVYHIGIASYFLVYSLKTTTVQYYIHLQCSFYWKYKISFGKDV